MKILLLLPLLILAGCVTTSEQMAALIGQDSHALIRQMGTPTQKEQDANGEVWIYESTSYRTIPARTTEKVTKRDKEGRPKVTESETYPSYEEKTIQRKYFFFNPSGRIYDTKYDYSREKVR